MKFFAELTERILGIEFLRELFVGGKAIRHGPVFSGHREVRHRLTRMKHGFRRFQRFSLQKISVNLCSSVAVLFLGRLHELDGCPIGVANVNDAFPGVRS